MKFCLGYQRLQGMRLHFPAHRLQYILQSDTSHRLLLCSGFPPQTLSVQCSTREVFTLPVRAHPDFRSTMGFPLQDEADLKGDFPFNVQPWKQYLGSPPVSLVCLGVRQTRPSFLRTLSNRCGWRPGAAFLTRTS